MVRLKGHNKAEEDDNPVDCVSLLDACHPVSPAKVDESDVLNALSAGIGLTSWLGRRKESRVLDGGKSSENESI